MNEELNGVIMKVKERLSLEPSSVVIGKFNEGIDLKNSPAIELNDYKEILEKFNGGRFGSIDLWSYSNLEQNQFRISEIEDQEEKWLEIGQILYEPLLLNKQSKSVYLFDTNEEKLHFLDYDIFLFLKNKIFGLDYSEVIPDYESDPWYNFLQKIDLV